MSNHLDLEIGVAQWLAEPEPVCSAVKAKICKIESQICLSVKKER